MFSRVSMLALAMAITGCGRAVDLAAPAPSGSVQCAVAAAEQMGYQRITGRAERGAVRVSQRLEQEPAQERHPQELPGPDEIRPVRRNPPVENQLSFEHRRGQLRIQVVGVNREGREIRAGLDAEDHAQMILAQCAPPPEVAG